MGRWGRCSGDPLPIGRDLPHPHPQVCLFPALSQLRLLPPLRPALSLRPRLPADPEPPHPPGPRLPSRQLRALQPSRALPPDGPWALQIQVQNGSTLSPSCHPPLVSKESCGPKPSPTALGPSSLPTSCPWRPHLAPIIRPPGVWASDYGGEVCNRPTP